MSGAEEGDRQAGVDPYLIPRRRRGGGMADEDHRRDEDVWGMPAIWEVRKTEKLLPPYLQRLIAKWIMSLSLIPET